MRTRFRDTPWLLLAAAIGGPAIVLLAPIPKGTRLVGIVLDLGHVALGAGLFYLLWRVLRLLQNVGVLGRGAWAWLGAMAVLTAFEAAQSFSSTRMPSVHDIISNGLGTTAGLFFVLAVRSGVVKRLAFAAIPLGIALAPAGLQTCDTIRQKAAFPVLADFETQLEMMRWDFRAASGMRDPEVIRQGQHTLRVTFKPGVWPAASFGYLVPDWSAYRTLAFDIRGDSPRKLLLTTMDKSYNDSWKDRFTHDWVLSTEWQTIRIPLADIQQTPSGRKLDLAQMQGMSWFADHPKEPFTIWLDAIRLEK